MNQESDTRQSDLLQAKLTLTHESLAQVSSWFFEMQADGSEQGGHIELTSGVSSTNFSQVQLPVPTPHLRKDQPFNQPLPSLVPALSHLYPSINECNPYQLYILAASRSTWCERKSSDLVGDKGSVPALGQLLCEPGMSHQV